MESPEYSIEVEGLRKKYNAFTAVHDLSFKVRPGEVIGFLGPNGAGKSTTMRILCGLLEGTSGLVRVCGIPVASDPVAAKGHIGYMPEHNPLPDDMRVGEYLRFRASLKGLSGRRHRQRVKTVMDQCDLARTAQHKIIGTLSKGFRQRVGIADALLAEPDIVIMDEPTIGLDPHQILQIRELIRSLKGRHTVIISSHILPEIEAVCDRVLIINQGLLVASGTPDELRREFMAGDRYQLCVVEGIEESQRVIGDIDPDAIVERVPAPIESGVIWSIVTRQGPDFGERLLDALRHAGVRTRHLHPVQPTLEAIFLQATRRAWDAEGTAGNKGARALKEQ